MPFDRLTLIDPRVGQVQRSTMPALSIDARFSGHRSQESRPSRRPRESHALARCDGRWQGFASAAEDAFVATSESAAARHRHIRESTIEQARDNSAPSEDLNASSNHFLNEICYDMDRHD
ncbi:MAG: hypothetical protein EB124_05320 [Betaproteobacteria bacterium]|nr:hypothetical protein [Betaproteobacteria bacterium]